MTVNQVLYVLEVAHCQSFSKAAENLFLSQPALSLQIKNLEAELGYILFSRTTRGVHLTKLGEQFCQDAEELAVHWRTFRLKVQAQNPDICRHLRIGVGSRVYSNHLFEEIVRFFELHTDIEATFITEAGQDFFAGLRDGTLDLALDRLPPEPLLPNQGHLFACDLISERQCILMSHQDPRSTLPSMSFQDLQGCTVITGLENSMEDRTLKQECRDFGITLNRLYRSDGIDTNMNLVRSGKGVVIGPESFASYYRVAAVPIVPEIQVKLKFICLRKNANRAEIAALRQRLLAVTHPTGTFEKGTTSDAG